MCSARSSLVASGRPKRRFIAFVDKAMCGFVRQHGSQEGKLPPRALSHGAGGNALTVLPFCRF
jgi:hypothetical protein